MSRIRERYVYDRCGYCWRVVIEVNEHGRMSWREMVHFDCWQSEFPF